MLVRDCGVGFSLDESVKILRNGGGIGLFGVRERVAAMGGAMTIESAPGQGTTIELTMPLDSAIAAEPAPAQLQLQPTRPKSKTRSALTTDARIRVLLVDDHALVRQGVANILKADPRTVVFGECGDGIEAIESIEREQPDIVLMDINMPRMNGIEATREIHRRWPDLPIIGLSVQDDDASSGAMRDAGAIAFISKVEEAERLIGAILQIHSSLSPTLPSPE